VPRISARRHILVVSYHAANALTPRGARTQAVARALSEHAQVRVIGRQLEAGRRTALHKARDRALVEAGSKWLLDPMEPWSWRTFANRSLEADVALLIGFPISPVVVAARALNRKGVPYIVDMSDPWGSPGLEAHVARFRERRIAGLERYVWTHAEAGIVTTPAQARDVHDIVPDLEVLVRANGYTSVEPTSARTRDENDGELHVGHFGNLYSPRLELAGFLKRVAESRNWSRVVLHQYGRDHDGELRGVSDHVVVRKHELIPWGDVVRAAAADLDIALVVGNKDPRQLPSKAIEYATLPVPRVALTGGQPTDALREYLDDKLGWLVMGVDDPEPGARLWAHVRRDWTAEDLAPPPAESWDCVAEELASFVLRRA
jgi:hypothetical protein